MTNKLMVSVLALGVVACGGTKATNTTNGAAPAPSNQAATAPANTVAAAGAVTPDQVRAMIAADGAREAVRKMNEGGSEAAPNRFALAMNGISTGEQAWLDIVPLIRPGVDGETGESLSMALSEALPRNAAGVLRVSGTAEEVPSVCDPVAFQDMSAERETYRAAAVAAVEAVSDPALQAVKTACLTTLRAAPAAR